LIHDSWFSISFNSLNQCWDSFLSFHSQLYIIKATIHKPSISIVNQQMVWWTILFLVPAEHLWKSHIRRGNLFGVSDDCSAKSCITFSHGPKQVEICKFLPEVGMFNHNSASSGIVRNHEK
jgi:hypothetical protein